MAWVFRAPPDWPQAPPGWVPPPGWTPDGRLPAAPADWQFWVWEQPAPRPRLTRSAKRTGIGILAGSLAVFVVAAVFGFIRAQPTLNSYFFQSPINAPTIVSRHLGTGSYAVFARQGYTVNVGGTSVYEADPMDVTPDVVSVTGPHGPVTVSSVDRNETISRGSSTYVRLVHFRVAAAGRYTIDLRTTYPTPIIVSEEFGSMFRGVLGWLIVGFVSLLGVLAGAIVLARGPRQSPTATPEWTGAFT